MSELFEQVKEIVMDDMKRRWKSYTNKEGQRFIITDGKGGVKNQDCKASYIDSDANQSLISAAPELLAALEIIMIYNDIQEGADMARAAIAKATGK